MRKIIRNTCLLVSLILNLSMRSDYLLIGLLVSLTVSLSILLFSGGAYYFNTAICISVLYIVLILIKDYSLVKNHFYNLLSISSAEIVCSKFIIYNLLSSILLFLVCLSAGASLLFLLLVNIGVSLGISLIIFLSRVLWK